MALTAARRKTLKKKKSNGQVNGVGSSSTTVGVVPFGCGWPHCGGGDGEVDPRKQLLPLGGKRRRSRGGVGRRRSNRRFILARGGRT